MPRLPQAPHLVRLAFFDKSGQFAAVKQLHDD